MAPVVRRAIILLLIVVVLVTGLPIAMAMGMPAGCHDCAAAVLSAAADCIPLALLGAALALLVLMATGRLRRLDHHPPALLYASLFERPPRWA